MRKDEVSQLPHLLNVALPIEDNPLTQGTLVAEMSTATKPTKSALAPVASEIPPTSKAPVSDWIRVAEACSFAKISKPLLYSWMERGLIRNVSMRERGRVKGLRLVSLASLQAFLESRATGGEVRQAQ